MPLSTINLDVLTTIDMTELCSDITSRINPACHRDLAIFLYMHANAYDYMAKNLGRVSSTMSTEEYYAKRNQWHDRARCLRDLANELDVPFTHAFWVNASSDLHDRIDKIKAKTVEYLSSNPNDSDGTPQ